MTSSNGNIFRVTDLLCGEFTGHRWIPRTKAVTRRFDAFFDLRQNKRLGKQSRRWWFETPSCSLWRHCNVRPEFEHTKFTPYPTHIGEIWGVCGIPRQLTGLHCVGMRHDKKQVESILNLLGPKLPADLLDVYWAELAQTNGITIWLKSPRNILYDRYMGWKNLGQCTCCRMVKENAPKSWSRNINH